MSHTLPWALHLCTEDCAADDPEDFLRGFAPDRIVEHLASMPGTDRVANGRQILDAEPGEPHHYDGPPEDLDALEEGLDAIGGHLDGSCSCWQVNSEQFALDAVEALQAVLTAHRWWWLHLPGRGRGQETTALVDGPEASLQYLKDILELDGVTTDADLAWDPTTSTLEGTIDALSRDSRRGSFELTPFPVALQDTLSSLADTTWLYQEDLECLTELKTQPDKLAGVLEFLSSLTTANKRAELEAADDLIVSVIVHAKHSAPWSSSDARAAGEIVGQFNDHDALPLETLFEAARAVTA